MMKYICTLALTISMFFAQAQNDSTGLYLGVNAVQLIRLAGSNSNSTMINPYLFEAGYSAKKFGLRFGLGMDNLTSTNQPAAANGNVKTQRDSSNNDWRIGGYYAFRVGQKWGLNIGLDFYSHNSQNLLATEFINETGFRVNDENLTTYKEMGISPYLRINYKPHPRVAIGTELLFRFGGHTLNQTTTSNLFPEFDTKLTTEGTRRYMVAPSALFVCLTL
jgi:hypothetical protein